MKNLKKIAIAAAVILTVGATSVTAFAASGYGTPAEIVAGLTGKTVESVVAEKTESGKTYGALAAEAGSLEEFRAEMLELKKERLQERVTAGTMTQERANEMVAAMEEKQANCDGTGIGGTGAGMGIGLGNAGSGTGAGLGGMNGNNQGGSRNASGRGTGTCLAD